MKKLLVCVLLCLGVVLASPIGVSAGAVSCDCSGNTINVILPLQPIDPPVPPGPPIRS
jgi:hypothetical protein